MISYFHDVNDVHLLIRRMLIFKIKLIARLDVDRNGCMLPMCIGDEVCILNEELTLANSFFLKNFRGKIH